MIWEEKGIIIKVTVMNDLSSLQRKAVFDALHTLRAANVPPETILQLHLEYPDIHKEPISFPICPSEPSAAIQKALYITPEAYKFTEQDTEAKANRLTCQSYVTALVDHPDNAIIKYPEAGKSNGEAVVHRFSDNFLASNCMQCRVTLAFRSFLM